ncbi:MAG: flagellar motor switch protein FliM [Candidatus Krumholzibacteriota bacterium]|nr:flagellar motor switch protein FliM [Candidatus Krumholzibacteriota bacterium]
MGGILTQTEANELLESIQTGAVEVEPTKVSSLQYAVPYDFSKPHSLSHAFAGNLATLSDSFAKAGSMTLSGLYRSSVTILSEGSRHLLFHEYINHVNKPSCLAILNLPPLRGQAVLEIDSLVVFALIDKLMGGRGNSVEENREFTEIEIQVAQKVIDKLLLDLAASAKRFVEMNPSLSRMENNPEFVNICAGNERIATIEFSLSVGEINGIMRLSIPITAFDTVMDKFDPIDEVPERTPAERVEDAKKIKESLRKVKLDVRVLIGETELALSQVTGMKNGDLIVLNSKVSEPIGIYVEGVPKFSGIPGIVNGKKAVQVISVLEGDGDGN